MSRRSAFALLALAALLTHGPSAAAQATLVIRGRIWTGDPAHPWASALAVAGDTIAAIGDRASVARLIGPATEVVDAPGLVTPGLQDGHTHFIDGGFQLASLDLRTVATPAEFIRRIRDFVRHVPKGKWIIGGDWDHTLWPGQPLPRHEWIDSVTPDNPVFLERLDGHEALANAAAMRAAGITRATAAPPGGEIGHDPRTGEPTGMFKDQALRMVYGVVPDPTPEERDSALVRALAYAASLGVTGTSSMWASFADLQSFRRIERAGRLTMRAALYLPLEDWEAVADTIAADGAGDDWVRIGGLKEFMDGSAGSRTAFFAEPYADSAGYRGLLRNRPADMAHWIGAADSVHLQVAVHAIGDSANAILLGIYDSVTTAHGPRDRRFRIEHAQHLRPQDISRFGRLGVIASVQPYHLVDDGRWIQHRIGPVRIHSTYPFRTLLDTHAVLAFGSDWTVATLDPIQGIAAAVTRRTSDGKNPGGWVPEQKITLSEALRAYTWGNAYANFTETHRGTLAPGKWADITVLDKDLFTLPPAELGTARAVLTVVGGKVVYRRPGALLAHPRP
ncbi:MAG TPA: amidohydrolase [Gemmatimonadales bacterium]|nr:amidohydrolase [Gemmatimonadales bacterium]